MGKVEDRLINYGGQAVIEGVMMRGQNAYALAMRAPDNEIIVETKPLAGLYRSWIVKIPLLRGLVLLWDALGLGMTVLTRSANQQSGEDEKIEGPTLYLSLGFALLVVIAIFFLAPAGVGWLSEHYLAWSAWWSNVLEGLVRMALLIGYIWAVGFMPDIQRVFSYHGAEHKTINAYEAGAELTPDSVSRYSIKHSRCGTAFLLTLTVISLLVFTVLGPLPLTWRLISRLLMIPILAGVAYEYIRWTAKNIENPIVKLLVRPNLALQSLATREPDREMVEVAIAAFKAMQQAEEKFL